MIGERIQKVKDGDRVWISFHGHEVRFIVSQDMADVINEERIPVWEDVA